MARDYLAIQGSSVPSERAFSGGGLTGTRLRGRLTPELFEALQILKSAYRNGHIKATEQASAAIEIMEILDDEEDEE
jgi:hAT family C-terminal dimerisation region